MSSCPESCDIQSISKNESSLPSISKGKNHLSLKEKKSPPLLIANGTNKESNTIKPSNSHMKAAAKKIMEMNRTELCRDMTGHSIIIIYSFTTLEIKSVSFLNVCEMSNTFFSMIPFYISKLLLYFNYYISYKRQISCDQRN